MLLDRLRADCDYFLGAGGRSEKQLWAGNVHAQIKKMRELYDALPEKPEWLTTEAIDRYAAQMAKAEGVTEALKATDPLRWTGLMNNLRHSAEELVLSDLIYA